MKSILFYLLMIACFSIMFSCQPSYRVDEKGDGVCQVTIDDYTAFIDSNSNLNQVRIKKDTSVINFYFEKNILIQIDSSNSNKQYSYNGKNELLFILDSNDKKGISIVFEKVKDRDFELSMFNRYVIDKKATYSLMNSIYLSRGEIMNEMSCYSYLSKNKLFFNWGKYANIDSTHMFDITILNGPVNRLDPFVLNELIYFRDPSIVQRQKLKNISDIGLRSDQIRSKFVQLYLIQEKHDTVIPKNYWMLEYKEEFIKTETELRDLCSKYLNFFEEVNSVEKIAEDLRTISNKFHFIDFKKRGLEINEELFNDLLKVN